MAEQKNEIQKVNKDTIKDLLSSPEVQNSISAVLPKHLQIEKLIKIAAAAVNQNPTLLKCTKHSLLCSILDAAKLGLPPDGTLGQGYLVPFWNKNVKGYVATFITGYRGYLTLARNSGEIQEIYSELVYKDDDFEYQLGIDRSIKHKRNLNFEPVDQNIIAAYMVVKYKDGGQHQEVMTRKQLERIRDRSPSKNKSGEIVGPWATDFGEMCRKTVIRRGIKYVPLSIEEPLAQAIEHDNDVDGLRNLDIPLQPLDNDDVPDPVDVTNGTVTVNEGMGPGERADDADSIQGELIDSETGAVLEQGNVLY